MTMTDDRDFPAKAIIAEEQLTNHDIRNAELDRAKHALVFRGGLTTK
jgi:hypothetical protein